MRQNAQPLSRRRIRQMQANQGTDHFIKMDAVFTKDAKINPVMARQ
jgi:hypothetical protein